MNINDEIPNNNLYQFIGVNHVSNMWLELRFFHIETQETMNQKISCLNYIYQILSPNDTTITPKTKERCLFNWREDEELVQVYPKFLWNVPFLPKQHIDPKIRFFNKNGLKFGDIVEFHRSSNKPQSPVDIKCFSSTSPFNGFKQMKGLFIINHGKLFCTQEFNISFTQENVFKIQFIDGKKQVTKKCPGIDKLKKIPFLLTWEADSLGPLKCFDFKRLLINFAKLKDENNVFKGWNTTRQYGNVYGFLTMVGAGRAKLLEKFNLMKDYIKQYLPIALELNKMTKYPLDDIFNVTTKTNAFDYLRYAECLKTKPPTIYIPNYHNLPELDDDDDDDDSTRSMNLKKNKRKKKNKKRKRVETGESMKGEPPRKKSKITDYPKFMIRNIMNGTFIINQRIECWDWSSFFSSVAFDLFKNNKNWKNNKAHQIQWNCLKKIYEIKMTTTNPIVRSTMKFLLNASIGLLNSKYNHNFPLNKVGLQKIWRRAKYIMKQLVEKCCYQYKDKITIIAGNLDSIIIVYSLSCSPEFTMAPHFLKFESKYPGYHLKKEGCWNYGAFWSSMYYVLQKYPQFNPDDDVAHGELFVSAKRPKVIRGFVFKMVEHFFQENIKKISLNEFRKKYEEHFNNTKLSFREYWVKDNKNKKTKKIMKRGYFIKMMNSWPISLNLAIKDKTKRIDRMKVFQDHFEDCEKFFTNNIDYELNEIIIEQQEEISQFPILLEPLEEVIKPPNALHKLFNKNLK